MCHFETYILIVDIYIQVRDSKEMVVICDSITDKEGCYNYSYEYLSVHMYRDIFVSVDEDKTPRNIDISPY